MSFDTIVVRTIGLIAVARLHRARVIHEPESGTQRISDMDTRVARIRLDRCASVRDPGPADAASRPVREPLREAQCRSPSASRALACR